MRIAVDFDDTLVDARTGEWLPGAKQALHELLTLYRTVIIHTCRANWPEGRAEVEAKIAEVVAPPWGSMIAAERIRIEPKPDADLYIDDKAVRFESWSQVMGPLRHERAQAEGLKLARKMMA